MTPRFLIVDDDPLQNKLCSFNLKKVAKSIEIHCFEFPVEGLEFIASNYGNPEIYIPTILLLDINMPDINGWEFLEEFAKMDSHIHEQFTTYILSSSINLADKEKAESNEFVKEFLSKPLSYEKACEIAKSVN